MASTTQVMSQSNRCLPIFTYSTEALRQQQVQSKHNKKIKYESRTLYNPSKLDPLRQTYSVMTSDDGGLSKSYLVTETGSFG